MKETEKVDLQVKPNEKYLESGILLRLYWYYSYSIFLAFCKATLYTFKLGDLQNHENIQNLPPEIHVGNRDNNHYLVLKSRHFHLNLIPVLNTEQALKRVPPFVKCIEKLTVKCIEVWKHGKLTSGKKDSKPELEALLFPFVITESRL